MSLLVWWWHRPFAILPAFLSLWTLCCPFPRWYWQWLLLSSFLFPLYGLIGCLCCLESPLGIYMLGLLLVLPRLVSGSFSSLFPLFITLHLAAPNCMWYLLATRLVTSSISCSFSRSWWIRHTSSIHWSESRVMFACVTHPMFLCLSSVAISSISVAHSITDTTVLRPAWYCPWFVFSLLAHAWFVSWLWGWSWGFWSFLSFSLLLHSGAGHRLLHLAMLCHMLFAHRGILCHCLSFGSYLWYGLF